MKKKILPIPLILLIPIVMLVVVIVAGLYRFSLTDEEILAKFPSSQVSYDPVVELVFDLKATNPWTIKVPETQAFAFIDEYMDSKHIASGRYDSGAERGTVQVATDKIVAFTIEQHQMFVAPMWVSNQGSGVFHYLALFKFDKTRSRVVLVDELLLGDRIQLETLDVTDAEARNSYQGLVSFNQHSTQQSYSEAPDEKVMLSFRVNKQSIELH
ncbi:hypothetical protein [Vibrio sp. Isolate30]|uniref:hypothetical protein n=1 Tax=Vibrio sp. Isolate30 TaxID=2908536 RepID=UPI001EFD961B|nr:hypothetical protein [Vibrio sp. Isolate30]MCG9629769.1 hypothetical protein [Vibrio sp. Isolate30]